MPNRIGGGRVRPVALDEDTVALATPPGPAGSRRKLAALVRQRARGHGFETSSSSTDYSIAPAAAPESAGRAGTSPGLPAPSQKRPI